MDKKRIQPKALESLVGRLNHTASIIPLTRHFLLRICKITSQNITGFLHVKITGKVLTDLQLWLFFLRIARDGISINLLVSRSPTKVGWSDSCPFGIGGTDARGCAWRIRNAGILAGNMHFNPFLLALPPTDTELVTRAFLSCVRNFKWCANGTLGLPHEAAVLSGTVRETTSHVAASFRHHFQCSPFHNPVGSHFLPSISNLLKSYTDIDPATKRQKAISPKLLCHMYSLAKGGGDSINFITAQLAIGGFFFAMRSCKQVQTPVPGKTKIIALDGCTFCCKNKHVMSHSAKHLHTAEYIMITWKDQKNGIRTDSRIQRRTGNPILCPITAFAYRPDSTYPPHGTRLQSFHSYLCNLSDTARNVSWLAPQAFNGPGSILVPKLHLLH
jgi:hypothetical protein